jgi:hypothetical protein
MNTERRTSSFAIFLLLCVFCCFRGYAQDRSKLSVYVPLPEGGTYQQKEYFQTSFKMELVGANYPSVETRAESAYTLLLTIQDNPAYVLMGGDIANIANIANNEDIKPFELIIRLVHSDNDDEVVSFSFLFDTLESMNEWNLYLLYQALANAYVGDDTPPPPPPPPSPPVPEIDDLWRNQMFYLNVGVGVDFGFFMHPVDGQIETGLLMPGLLAGLEWHFLDFLSLELDVKPRFYEKLRITLAAALTVRGVFKFSSVMLELYGGMEYGQGLNISVPPLSVLGGFQLGFRGAPLSAWVLDAGFTQYISGTFRAGNTGEYTLRRFHLLAGFKFGFRDRKPPSGGP